MDIRPERLEDREDVRAVHVAAFGDEGDAVADLADGLRDWIAEDDRYAAVAVQAGQIVGHVMFSRSLLDAPRRLVEVQVLGPLGVRPDTQRRGVGSALVRHGLRVMAERRVPVVFLEGHPGYYPRFGFAPGAEQGFRKPSLRIPDAAFQAIRLSEYEPWMTGTLVYPEIIWRHDAVGLRDPDA